MKRILIAGAMALALTACNHGNAHAWGSDGGGDAPGGEAPAPGPAVGPGPGAGNNGGVGNDPRDRVPYGQPGPSRPKGNICSLVNC